MDKYVWILGFNLFSVCAAMVGGFTGLFCFWLLVGIASGINLSLN